MPIQSGKPLPRLVMPLIGGGNFVPGDPPLPAYTILVFYRGLHCQRCPGYLSSVQDLLGDFDDLGAKVLAVSSDDEGRATRSVTEWGLDRLPVAYGFPVEAAPDWGLYVSEGKKAGDPPRFTEPAVFIVDAKGMLDLGIINTGPRLRPEPERILAHVAERLKEAKAA